MKSTKVSHFLQWDAWLSLIRLPNTFTVFGDPFVGFLLCGGTELKHLIVPAILSVLLYIYGLILNDFVDFKIDRIERPDRPLPSGRISLHLTRYIILIAPLLIVGLSMICAWTVTVATIIVLFLVLLYNFKMKTNPFWGPIFMALCRIGSIFIGVAAVEKLTLDSNAIFLICPVISYLFYVYGLSRLAQDEMLAQPNRFGRISILIGASVPLALFCHIVSLPDFTINAQTMILLIFSLYLVLTAFKTFLVLAAPFRTTKDVQKQVTHLIGNFTLFQGCWIAMSQTEYAAIIALIVAVMFIPFFILTRMWKAT